MNFTITLTGEIINVRKILMRKPQGNNISFMQRWPLTLIGFKWHTLGPNGVILLWRWWNLVFCKIIKCVWSCGFVGCWAQYSMTMHFDPEDGGSTFSETSFSNHHITERHIR